VQAAIATLATQHILIAEFKRAIVDLGTLAPGTYTISDATGGATAITVMVS